MRAIRARQLELDNVDGTRSGQGVVQPLIGVGEIMQIESGLILHERGLDEIPRVSLLPSQLPGFFGPRGSFAESAEPKRVSSESRVVIRDAGFCDLGELLQKSSGTWIVVWRNRCWPMKDCAAVEGGPAAPATTFAVR